MTPTSDQLTAINLRYGTTSKSLKTLSFANLIAKAISVSGRPLDNKEIGQKVAEILEIRSIDQNLVLDGLEELEQKRDIYKTKKGKWNLNKNAQEKIYNGTIDITNLINGVITRHFPQSIDQEILTSWFNMATIDFFGHNGEECVKSVCLNSSGNPKIKTTDELLKKSIEKFKLTKYSGALINGFQAFLASSNKEDQKALMHFIFAMFSAKLITSDVGADPITLKSLRDSTFIIDTNFIFPLQLEAHRYFDSFSSLGKALKEINAKIVYINETKEEHSRVLNGKKGSILKLVKDYPLEVTINAEDPFIATAKKRACIELCHFETFFTELQNLPKDIPDGPELNLLDNKDIEKIIEKAKKDQKLKTKIQEWRLKLRPYWDKRPKTESALNHDASIIYVQEDESKNSKVYVLTLDRSLQVCATERAGNHSMPPVIYLEGLIQVLAINNGGPNIDVTNYAPFLSSIILKRCAPPEDTYTLEDLHWLYSIQKNVAKFEPEKIKQIALEIARARLAGKKVDDKNLRRIIDRFYQEEIKEVGKVVQDAELKVTQVKAEIEQERNLRKISDNKLLIFEHKEQKRKALGKLGLQILWRLPTSIVATMIVYYLLVPLVESNGITANGDIILSSIVFLISGWGLLIKPINIYIVKTKELKQNYQS